MSRDAVVGFLYQIDTYDGCQKKSVYQVSEETIKEISSNTWEPMTPSGDVIAAKLTTHFKSGKSLDIDLEDHAHSALLEHGRFDKLLQSIVRGNMPGEALKRQLTKALDLPTLPKVKRKMKSGRP